MLRLIPILLACAVFSFADVEDVSIATASVTDSLIATVPDTHYNPYEMQEQIEPDQFQNRVVRAALAKKAMSDQTLASKERAYAKAAYYFYSGYWDEAFKSYKSLLGHDSVVDATVALRLIRIRFMQGEYSKMRKEIRKHEKKYAKDAAWTLAVAKLRVEAALADSAMKASARADSIKTFLKKYPKLEYSIALKYRYAKILEQLEREKEAKRLYFQLMTTKSAYKDSAFASMKNLRAVSGEPESLSEKVAYAKMACIKDEVSNCLSLLDSIMRMDAALVEKNPEQEVTLPEDSLLSELPPSTLDLGTRIVLWEKRAVALRGLSRFDESIAQFRYLLDSVEARPVWMRSILKMYRDRPDEFQREIMHYDSLLQDVSQFSKDSANRLWVRGFEYEQKSEYDSALICFNALTHPRFKKNPKRQWAKFRIGFIYFKQQLWDLAATAFSEAKEEPFMWPSSAARMFLGDTYMKMGKLELAREAYLDCIQDFPLGYYAHRSRLKLAENSLMSPELIPYAHGVSMSEKETMDWVRSMQKGNVAVDSATYNRERYERIKQLFKCGFAEEAFALYDEGRRKNAKRLDFLYEYGKLFYEMGETAAGYRLARQFQSNIDRRQLLAPPIDVLHYLYPIPYTDVVKFHSGSRIDPFFVYSVMRQESIFNFEIKSPAGACGLLQIMPSTGKMLAGKEEIENFTPKQLYNAYMNIRLGIRYLVDLKAQYEEDYMYVLGNYNAGPKPTKRWKAAGEGLPWDIRAEDISYWETRDYVKRVMGNYWIYQEIYDSL